MLNPRYGIKKQHVLIHITRWNICHLKYIFFTETPQLNKHNCYFFKGLNELIVIWTVKLTPGKKKKKKAKYK